jgi:hypothetical protein
VCNGHFGSPVGPERFAAVPPPGVKTFPRLTLHGPHATSTSTSTSRSLMDHRARRYANRCGQAGSGTPPGSPPGSSGVGSMGAGGSGSGASGSSSPRSSGTGASGSIFGSGSGSDAPMGWSISRTSPQASTASTPSAIRDPHPGNRPRRGRCGRALGKDALGLRASRQVVEDPPAGPGVRDNARALDMNMHPRVGFAAWGKSLPFDGSVWTAADHQGADPIFAVH